MTSTPALPSDIKWVEVPISELIEQTESFAADAGRAQAMWLDISWESQARRLLTLIEDGDPVADEYGPAPAFVPDREASFGDMSVASLIRMLDLDPDSVSEVERDQLIESYETTYRDEYWAAVERRCREFIAAERAELDGER